MKNKVKVEEIEGEGLVALLGRRALVMSAGYFYEGILESVNDAFIKLKDPHIVYDTGAWSSDEYLDIQSLNQEFWYVQLSLIESYGLSKND